MHVQKKVLFLSVFLMVIGFAAVSATLYLNGTIGIGTNNDDFDVYFSKAVENGVENNSLIQDKTHLAFRTELSKINEKYVLEYDVTNASKQYDASIVINCTGSNEYLRVENKFNVVEDLKARSTRSGKLTLTVIKSVFEETEVSINCEIRGNAKERTEAGGETIDKEPVDYLRTTGFSSTIYLGHELNKSKVESITLKNTKEVPNNAIESWDVSVAGNGSIMAYTLDEDNNELLELYIGQNGGVNANPNSTYLFHDFTTATRIDCLEYLDTSQVTNMVGMFYECGNIRNLDLSHFDTSKVTNMNNMFYGCGNLLSLDVSSFDTSNVTSMGTMFGYCSKLVELDVSSFDTRNVTIMSTLFYNCGSLVDLNLSHFNTSNVTTMWNMFSECGKLTNLDLSSFDTRNVKSMSYMFYGCSRIKNLDLGHFDTSKVTDMSSMFRGCIALTDLNINHFSTSKVKNMSYMFSSCENLTSINIDTFNTESVVDMSYMFFGCSKIITLDISKWDISNVTSLKNMFWLCSNLEVLDVSNWNTSNVTNMSGIFAYCEKLESLNVSTWNTDKVTDMSSTFAYLRKVEKLDVGNWNTSNVETMKAMFVECNILKEADLSSFDLTNVTNLNSFVAGCHNLVTEFTVRGTNCTNYAGESGYWAIFTNTAIGIGSIKVHYTSDASELVDKMIATKSTTSNVTKGSVVV